VTSVARILTADDNEVNRKILSKQLHKLGFSMDAVASGSEVVAAFQQRDYALVLMDVNMGGMDGYAATRAIRNHQGRARVPIIATTANPDLDEQQRCLDAGMDDLLGKPITLGTLAVHLVRWGASRASRASWQEAGPAAISAEAGHDQLAEDAVDRLRRLERATGKQGLTMELIDEFLERAPARIRRIKKALEQGDAGKLEQERFALMMHSAGIGAVRLEQVASTMGSAAPDRRATLADAAERAFTAVAAELREIQRHTA
jgi:CheY-like chemotaxis protein